MPLTVSFVFTVFSATFALAQGATINGKVVDQQNAAVAGAHVLLTSTGQPMRTETSAADGGFTFADVAPSTYTLQAEAPGFAPAIQSVAVAGSPVSVTVALLLAAVVEDVTVQGPLLGAAATGKTSLPVRDLPLTIQSVPKEIIAEQAANDLVTALQNTAGTYAFMTYGAYEYYYLRGFFDSVQLLDGVRNDGVNPVSTQLTNVERVEVLKGPSSALYGAGAVGGAVNIIRKKPSAIPAYDFMGAFGDWETARGAFGATGRLGSDAVLYRLDLGGETRAGYRHDPAKLFTVTPSLAWRVGDNSRLNVYYSFNRTRFGGDAGLPLVDTSLRVPTEQNVLDVPRDRNYRTPYDKETSQDHNVQVVFGRQLTGSLGFRDVVSYRHLNDEYLFAEETDFIPPTTIDRYFFYYFDHRRHLTNIAELTAHVTRGVQQELLFGWETRRYSNYTPMTDEPLVQAASIDAFNPVETQGPPELTISSQSASTGYTNGFYVQDHLTLGPRVKLLLGGRYDIYRRSNEFDDLTTGTIRTTKREANALTGRVGVVYQPVPRLDLYGSWANSFTPLFFGQPDGSSLDPESGSQWELGQRARVLHDRVQLTAAVYRILRQNVPFRRAGNVYVQAGNIRSRGFEADLETSLVGRWRVNVSYGFTDATFLDYEESPGVNRRGNQTPFAPRNTVNVWTGYEWKNGFGVNVGTRYFGQIFQDSANMFAVDGYGLLNLAARYRRGPMEFALNINNVTDTTYFIPHQDYLQVYPGLPVSVLGTIRLRLR